MNTAAIKNEIKLLGKKQLSKNEEEFVRHYLGTKKKILGAKTGDIVKIARKIVSDQGTHSRDDLVKLLDDLFTAQTIEEHLIGGKVFTFLKPLNRKKISFEQLEKWLSKTNGWVEVDVICQSTFTAEEVLERWKDWEKFIKRLSENENIQLRRASLVLQNPSARKSNDKKIRKLAFATIEKLKSEKNVLITKAISWLLRSLAAVDNEEVKEYLVDNESTLPRIAFRETMKKIETGKK